MFLLFKITFVAVGLFLSYPITAQEKVYIQAGVVVAEFEPSTCSSTVIGDMGMSMGDIALTPEGRLFGIRSSVLYEISTTDATAEPIILLPYGSVSLVALNNEYLLFESYDSLFTVRIDGTDLHSLGYIGFSASGDLTWLNGDLYMAAGYSALIRIVMNEDLNEIIQVDSVGVMNTGVGQIYGVVTVEGGECAAQKRLLAFDTYDVYEVDPTNAEVTPLCLGAFEWGVRGAATTAELAAIEPIKEPVLTNIFTPNGDGINDLFLPEIPDLISIHTFEIYDRWGMLMFKAVAPKHGWDGHTFAGLPCPEGTYFYHLKGLRHCEGEITAKGHLTLLR